MQYLVIGVVVGPLLVHVVGGQRVVVLLRLRVVVVGLRVVEGARGALVVERQGRPGEGASVASQGVGGAAESLHQRQCGHQAGECSRHAHV